MKSLITTGLLVASLALSGNAAMAAGTATHKSAIRHVPAAARLAQRPPRDQFEGGLAPFFQAMFGAGLPVRYARSQPSYRSSGTTESFDSSPSIDSSATDAQVANDAEVQAIQSMNDSNALNASMAAAEAQNEAAQAAAIQTEINANN